MISVTFTRGGRPESVHRVAWAQIGPDGDAGTGDLVTFPRSAIKPLQALPGAAALDALGLGPRHLALACASHGGTAEHLAGVREILAAAGVDEAALRCGALEPRDPGAAAQLRADGLAPQPIHHNCSGKHALGLALCRVRGWPTEGYLDAGHPLQHAMRAAVTQGAGLDEVAAGVDGCGMPAFALPLGALARAFAHLDERVAAAMRAHPLMVAYDGAVDTELMRAEPALVAKVGAEGVLAVGTADGRALALKVVDGGMRAIDPAGVALVRERLGVAAASPALDALARPQIVNAAGVVVGEGEVQL
jgi:L-asparaginase II